MGCSTLSGGAPRLLLHNHTRLSNSIQCRQVHKMEVKMECKQTHEAKTKTIKLEETLGIRRRDIVAFGCLVTSATALQVTEPQLARGEDGLCELTLALSGLGYCDTLIGTGIEASEGQLIKAHYTGKLENGKIFDSSYNRGQPLTFRVGIGEVIKGWDQGILGGAGIPPMLAGGKRTLKIPPELGYGIRGAGCRGGSCVIPPNSVLLFDVEFVGKA